MTEKNPNSAGGLARAEKLSQEERTTIAKQAAQARWDKNKEIPKATHRGEITIGDVHIPCAVLNDGRRVLTETGVTYAILGQRSGAAKRKKAQMDGGALLPLFVGYDRLKPFFTEEIMAGPLAPIHYRDGTRLVGGYEATILPAACEIWLKARDANALHPLQAEKAQRADLLMRGLAQVGIVALVDEATGYQEVRDKRALQAILDTYLRQEFAAWAKRFPDEFYKQMFRLKGWGYNPLSVARPGVVGTYTKDLVYERLAPGIVAELSTLNPKNDKGHRTRRHHQWLTDDIGHPALSQHLHAVMGLMRASPSWDEFMLLLDRAFPKKGQTIDMLLD